MSSPQIIVVPLQLWEDDREAFKRAIDQVFEADPADEIDLSAPRNPQVEAWLDRYRDALIAFARRRRGFVYIHDRLDHPPESTAQQIAPGARNETIGGYAVVWLDAKTAERNDQLVAVQHLIRQRGTTHVIVHCRGEHHENPAAYDQPFIVAIPYSPTKGGEQ